MQKHAPKSSKCLLCYPANNEQKAILKAMIKLINTRLQAMSEQQPTIQNAGEYQGFVYLQNKFKPGLESLSHSKGACKHKRVYQLFKGYSHQQIQNITQTINQILAERTYQLEVIQEQIKNVVFSISRLASSNALQNQQEKVVQERRTFTSVRTVNDFVQRDEILPVRYPSGTQIQMPNRSERGEANAVINWPVSSPQHQQNIHLVIPISLFLHFQP